MSQSINEYILELEQHLENLEKKVKHLEQKQKEAEFAFEISKNDLHSEVAQSLLDYQPRSLEIPLDQKPTLEIDNDLITQELYTFYNLT